MFPQLAYTPQVAARYFIDAAAHMGGTTESPVLTLTWTTVS